MLEVLYGQNYLGNISNHLYSSNNIIKYAGSHVGGAVGNTPYTPTRIRVENTIIYQNAETSNSQAIGGAIGDDNGTKLSSIHVKNCIIDAGTSSMVGGIIGHKGSATFWNPPQYRGGPTRKLEGTCQNSIIKGSDKVGGIVGQLATGYIENSYTNAYVEATGLDGKAGGIIGYLHNAAMDSANQNKTSTIRENYVAYSYITASNTKIGGLIGWVEDVDNFNRYYKNYYTNNLVISNLDNYIGGTLSTTNDLTNSIKHSVNVDTDIIDNLNDMHENSHDCSLYDEALEICSHDLENINDNVSIQCNTTIQGLNNRDYYTNSLGWSDTTWNYNTLSENYFPIASHKNDVSGYNTYGIIPLPGTTGPAMMSFSLRNNLVVSNIPKYEVYTSDVNKINLEFSKLQENTYFRYETNNFVSENIPIEKRVYTFEYDFNCPIKIIIGNENGEEETVFEANNIAKKLSVVDRKYYYLENNILKETVTAIDGIYVNLFNDKALTTDGYIYDLKTNTTGTKKVEGIQLLEESTPLAEYTYLGNIIETYYNFSKIISSNDENITEYQTFIKNGELFVLDGSLDIYGDSVIIDAYNNKEYQTALGKDGIIYDFKDRINYPEDFENENIIQMTNNINSDTSEVLIMYEDGRIYAFNYITGNVLFDSDEPEEQTLFEEIANTVMSLFRMSRPALYSPEAEEYEAATQLQEKLEDTSLEQAVTEIAENSNKDEIDDKTNITFTAITQNNDQTTNTTNTSNTNNNTSTTNTNTNSNASEKTSTKPAIDNTTSENTNNTSEILTKSNDAESYITVYDSDTNKYLVYKTSSILGNTETAQSSNIKEPVSETEKIESNPELKEYYETANGNTGYRKISGALLIIISISAIGIILVFMYKKRNYV